MVPLIGIIADHNHVQVSGRDRIFVGVYETYVRALVAANALPVIIPLELSLDALRGIFDRLDGILLTGGGDIEPEYYGETRAFDTVREIKPDRDSAELHMAKWAAEEDVPLLGICRGHQVANVALGGNLYQDIAEQLQVGDLHHRNETLDKLAHTVHIDTGSRLAEILGKTTLVTNSHHHQAVKTAAPQLTVTAHSDDGVIEAAELPTARYYVTVQWHPENTIAGGDTMPALFQHLVSAAAEFRQSRNGS